MKYSINTTKAHLAEVQTTLHWYLEMIKAPSIGTWDQSIVVRCSSTGVPEVNSQTVAVNLQGHQINYVGKTTKSGSITLNFAEGIDSKVANYFYRWENAKWSGNGSDTQGVQNLTNSLKADLRLTLCSPDDKPTQIFTLVGCLPSYTHGMQFSQDASVVYPTVSFEYDDFHISGNPGKW